MLSSPSSVSQRKVALPIYEPESNMVISARLSPTLPSDVHPGRKVIFCSKDSFGFSAGAELCYGAYQNAENA